MNKNCILECDSPSYPPSLEEYKQCGCEACLKHVREQEEMLEEALRMNF